MAREQPKETMRKFNESGGISSNQTPEEAQRSVEADIARHEESAANADSGRSSNNGTQTKETSSTPTQTSALDTARQVIDRSSQRANRMQDWLASQPTPGGIAALVVILFVLVFLLVPVDKNKKYSRVQLLFLSLLGKTRLEGHRELTKTEPDVNASLATMRNFINPGPAEEQIHIEEDDTAEDPLEGSFWDSIDNLETE